MRLIIYLIAILMVQEAGAAKVHETVRRLLPASAVEKVAVSSTNGSIIVTGWDKDSILIVAHKKLDGSGSKAWETLKSVKVVSEIQGHTLKIFSEIPKRQSHGWLRWLLGLGIKNFSVSYEIKMPNKLTLEASSTNGDVELDDDWGALSVSTTNGNINALRIKGPADLHSTNGDIHVYYLRLPEKGRINISTTNGKIDLILPQRANCQLSAYSTTGKIVCNLADMHRIKQSKRFFKSEIGQGGIYIDLETTNGNISVSNK